MHALVGEGEGEADAEGARAVDARVAGAGVGGAVADAARVVCAPAAGATGMTTTGPADGTDATRGTTMGGIMQVDAPRPQNGAGAVAAGAPGAAGSGGSGAARAAKYNMATLEERTRFKLRCEVLMLEIKDRNHKGKQGALSLFLLSPGRAQARARSLSLLSLPRALCARSDQTVETVDWTKSWPPSP